MWIFFQAIAIIKSIIDLGSTKVCGILLNPIYRSVNVCVIGLLAFLKHSIISTAK